MKKGCQINLKKKLFNKEKKSENVHNKGELNLFYMF